MTASSNAREDFPEEQLAPVRQSVNRRNFLQCSIRSLLGTTTVIGTGIAIYRRAIHKMANRALYDVTPQQMEALESYIQDFNTKKDHWIYGDLIDIKIMVKKAEEIAGLTGTTFQKVLFDARQDPRVLEKEIQKIIPAMMDDLVANEAAEVPTGTLPAVRRWYREEPSKAIDEAMYLAESFLMTPENVHLTAEKKKDALLKGMERCLLRWAEEDPDKKCFVTSSRYQAFCNNLAMLIEGSPDPTIAIAHVLDRHKFSIDSDSQENLYAVVSEKLKDRKSQGGDSELFLPNSDTLSLK